MLCRHVMYVFIVISICTDNVLPGSGKVVRAHTSINNIKGNKSNNRSFTVDSDSNRPNWRTNENLSKNYINKHGRRSFEVDYSNKCFRKDGEVFRFVSGSLHYFRVHPSDWADRLRKMRYAGLNVVQTYVEWSSHEPEPGQYDFTGGHDLVRFLEEAQRQDLLVILRVGPYICAERDMGGFPYWLLRLYPNIRLRTADPQFVNALKSWLQHALFPRIRPLLYQNGGPIIMMQTENEYGNFYACDYNYTSQLRELFRDGLGDQAVLFTTDNGRSSALRCGKIPLVYATVDFGPDADVVAQYRSQRLFEPRGPLVNSEFYTGWLDHWGEPHHKTDAKVLSSVLNKQLGMNASVNMYMFHGGTNFGFTSGANIQGNFKPCPTSYDYDAPLSEAGDMTNKYFAIRDVVAKYLRLPDGPAPSNSSKGYYGPVVLEWVGHHLSLAEGQLLEQVQSPFPLTFEQLMINSGMVAYETTVTFSTPDPSILRLGSLHDRGYVHVNGVLQGVVSRSLDHTSLPIRSKAGDKLLVLVEEMGRVNVGIEINDFKGLTTNVTLNSRILSNWTMTPLPLTDYDRLTSALEKLKHYTYLTRRSCRQKSHDNSGKRLWNNRTDHWAKCCRLASNKVGIYRGVLNIPEESGEPKDTFLRMDGWTKGIAWVNGFCLGRYWPVMGPQATLYVPHAVLQQGPNEVLLLELEGAGGCSSYPSRNVQGRHQENAIKTDENSDGKQQEQTNTLNDDGVICTVKFVDVPDIDADVPTN